MRRPESAREIQTTVASKSPPNDSQPGAKPGGENPLRLRRQFPSNDIQELSCRLKGALGKQSRKLIMLGNWHTALPGSFSKVVEP